MTLFDPMAISGDRLRLTQRSGDRIAMIRFDVIAAY
jgi:hypothetical protein